MRKLLLLHGFMGFPNDFSKLIDELSKYYDNIFAPVLPGHTDKKVCWKEYSSFIEDFYQTNIAPEKNLDCVGYSMGGRILLSLLDTDQYNNRAIKNVALISSSFGLQTEKERKQRYESDCELFSDIKDFRDYELFLRKWARLPIFKGLTDSEFFEEWLDSRMNNNPYELQIALKLLSVSHMKNYLQNIPLPKNKIIYICGELDKKYRELSKRINIPSFVIPECSHNVLLQKPKELSKIIIQQFHLS